MRIVIQRVKKASVEIDQKVVGAIGSGLLVFLGVGTKDTEKDCEYLAQKTAHLRIFADSRGLMNLSILEAGGAVLVVSQFTLWADCRKGRRPSFIDAAAPDKANRLYEYFISALRGQGLTVAFGRFQEMMDVHLVNDGPVTILLDSQKALTILSEI